MEDESIRIAMNAGIAHLFVADFQGRPRPVGTAFVVSRNYALTAFHCVGNRKTSREDLPQLYSQPVILGFLDGTRLKAECICWDVKLDFALLRLLSPLPEFLQPIRLSLKTDIHARCRLAGYPTLDGPDIVYSDAWVVAPNTTIFGGTAAIQLRSEESSGGLSLHGMSGGPVLAGLPESAIGVIRWNPTSLDNPTLGVGGIVFACPIRSIVEQSPELEPFVLTSTVGELAGRIAASTFAGLIENYLQMYLITEDGQQKVPFGGRQKEINLLDRWLEDPQSASRFLVAAPAGRGKSALLVNWLERLEAKRRSGAGEVWELAFVPISIRFGTNRPEIFYEAIAGRLADILHLDLAPAHSDPVTYYQDWCQRLLVKAIEQQVRILLIIDGIDEALGGSFSAIWFPLSFGARIRLLVSARLQVGDQDSRGWVERLGWATGTTVARHDLSALVEEDVRDVLVSFGAPLDVLAFRPEMIFKLYNLTQGEPLLLRFYLDDLQKHGEDAPNLRVEDLDRIEPGYRGYFDEWLYHQREAWNSERETGRQVDENSALAHLAVLACAYGRLAGEELSYLVQRVYGITRAFRIKDALHPLRRFVIGGAERPSGGLNDGYILNHPKLNDFLREDYFDQFQIERVQRGFADWGRGILGQLNTGKLAPKNASLYLVQYLSQHFMDVDAPTTDFLDIVEEGWLRAWEAFEGGYRGFSRDVQRAREVTTTRQADGQAAWAGQLRCQLVLSSIASTGSRIPSLLLAECVRYGVLSVGQALYWLEYQPIENQAEALSALAPHLPEVERTSVFDKALQAAQRVRFDYSRASILIALTPGTPASLIDRLLRAVLQIHDEGHRSTALAALVPHMPASSFGELLQVALELRYDEDRVRVLVALAPYLPAPLLGRALAAARLIGATEDRAEAIVALAPHLPEPEQAPVLSEALETVRQVWGGLRTRLLAALAPCLPDAQRAAALCEALEGAWQIYKWEPRANVLAALAPRLPESQRVSVLREVLSSAARMLSLDLVADALAGGTAHLPEAELAGFLDKILQSILARRPYEFPRVPVLAALAPHMPALSFDKALRSARNIPDVVRRAEIFATLAPYLSDAERVGSLRAALLAVRQIGDHEPRSKALATLASYLPEAERVEVLGHATQAALQIGDDRTRARVLITLAPQLPHAERADILRKVLRTAQSIPDHKHWAEALAALVPSLPEVERPRVRDEALQAALQIQPDKLRAEALLALAPYLPENERTDVLRNALKAIAKIEPQLSRGKLLVLLAPAATKLVSRPPYGERCSALGEAVQVAQRIDHHGARMWALSKLAPYLPEPDRTRVLGEELQVAQRIDHHGARMLALSKLAPHLPESDRTRVLGEALEVAQRIDAHGARAEALSRLAPYLPEADRGRVTGEALRAARKIDDLGKRAKALTSLAPHLPDANRARVVGEALQATRQIEEVALRAQALADLAPHLPEAGRANVFIEAVQAAQRIPDYEASVRAVTGLLVHLPDAERTSVLSETLRAVRQVHSGRFRAGALAALAPYLPHSTEVCGDALQTAEQIPDSGHRAEALGHIVLHLPEKLQEDALQSFILSAIALGRGTFLLLLPHFFPTIARVEGSLGILQIYRAIRETSQWFP